MQSFLDQCHSSNMDTYRNFESLKNVEKEGVDYQVVIAQREGALIGICAPHGGGIEPGTSEIAKAIAGDDCSYFAFEGIKSTENTRLHITSENFDEPRCVKLAAAVAVVAAIHGENPDRVVVYMGGRKSRIANELRAALTKNGFEVETHNNPGLQGTFATNICNRGIQKAGIQLELSKGLRTRFFSSLNSSGRKRPTAEFRIFVDAVREGLGLPPLVQKYEADPKGSGEVALA